MGVSLPLQMEEFITWLTVERGRSANTVLAYRRDLATYVEFLRERSLALTDVTEATLEDFVGALRHRQLAPASVRRITVTVRSFHRFLVAENPLAADGAVSVRLARVPSALPKALTEAEIVRLLDAVVGVTPTAYRDRAMLELLYGTGMRVGELCGLSLSDLDLDESMVRVLGKGSKERMLPLGRLAAAAIGEWLGPRGRVAGGLLRSGLGSGGS